MTTYYDDFSGSTGGAAPSGWTERWADHTTTTDTAGANSYLGGKAAMVTSTDSNSYLLSMDAPGSVADVEILCRTLDGSNAGSNAAGVAVRCSGTYSTRGGYVLRKNGGTIQLYSLVSNVATLIASANVPFGGGTEWAWWRLRANGSTISGKTWRCHQPEPADWQVSVTNTAVSAAGWAGVYTNDIDRDPYYFDVVSVGTGGDTAPMPSSIASGQLRVSSVYLEVLASNTLTVSPVLPYVAMCVN